MAPPGQSDFFKQFEISATTFWVVHKLMNVASSHFRLLYVDPINDSLWAGNYAVENIIRTLSFLRLGSAHFAEVKKRYQAIRDGIDFIKGGKRRTIIYGVDGDFLGIMVWGSNDNAKVLEFLIEAHFKQQGLTALDSENEDEFKIDRNTNVVAMMVEIQGPHYSLFDDPIILVVLKKWDDERKRYVKIPYLMLGQLDAIERFEQRVKVADQQAN